VDVNIENNALQDYHTSASEENPNQHDIDSNDSDVMDVQSISPIPSSIDDSHTFQTPNPTERRIDISFLCNRNDEEFSLRQQSESDLFNNNLSLVQKRSWAKESTCEQIHLTYLI
jgi:hypothetical protein